MSNYWRRRRPSRDDLMLDDPINFTQMLLICIAFCGMLAGIAVLWSAVFHVIWRSL